jgi:predicted phosphate transport protein (TIGR00153 family)
MFDAMLSRLLPRNEAFFDSFNQLSDHLATSARMLHALFEDPGDVNEHVRKIKEVEHKADLLTANVNQRIDKSFITPIDREDIHTLASRLDDVIDLVDGTSRRFQMLHITSALPPAKQLSDVLMRAADEIERAVKDIRKPALVNEHVVAIKQLEEEGDAIYNEAVGALFSGRPDALEVIKWKEMYDTLERTIDACMGVAQVLQSISLKNA